MSAIPKRLAQLKDFLDERVIAYNRPEFIEHDPVSIPHQFSQKQDIEISGLFAATLAWGQRVTIIKKCQELLRYMDHAPYQFILHHQESDLKPFEKFKHRTFNAADTLYFISFLQRYYREHASLEDAFAVAPSAEHVGEGLTRFRELFFDVPDYPRRTEKHISSPRKKSACKRLNMYLRWMVRQDSMGVDFGIWASIKPAQLICPCDVHVERVARSLKLIRSKTMNWDTAVELTRNLRTLDPSDPVKYDFALFGLGVLDSFGSSKNKVTSGKSSPKK